MSSQRICGLFLQRLLCALGLAWSFLLCTAAWAQDQVLEKAYWTDTSGSASFDQAQAASYTPYQ